MKCIFTGKNADSAEHVIPLWLQNRFSLSEETIFIPNGTTLKYKHHKVPADKEANNRFGVIEDRISRGIFDLPEVYLWALKLHIGCIHRDGSLRFDIKDPSSPFILNVSDFSQEVWLFQQLFENWANGGQTDPSPFGSVFIVDSLSPTPRFDFTHCLITGTIAIDIGGKFILVFLWDQGDAMHANVLEPWEKWHLPFVKAQADTDEFEAHCYMASHVWACETAYWIYRQRRSHSMIKTPNKIVLVPPLWRSPGKPHAEAEYHQVCLNFGLDLVEYKGEVSNVYQQSKLLGAAKRVA